jgi:XTP/dITP diphosphohydrolase
MRKLLIATHNVGKVEEYRQLLADLPLAIRSLDDEGITVDVEETGTTFAENATLKARAYAEMTGLWTWADDSGLEVEALDGRPGVYSARYAGPDATSAERNAKLVSELQALGESNRRARFRCVVALCLPGAGDAGEAPILTTTGSVEGQIIDAPRGEHGFGYDPIFYLPEFGKTMAQLPAADKNAISHRGHAARAAKVRLHDVLEQKT